MRRAALLLLPILIGCGSKPTPPVVSSAPAPATAQEVAELRQQMAALQQTVQQNTTAQNAIATALAELKAAIAIRPAVEPTPVVEPPALEPKPPLRIPESLYTETEIAMRDNIAAALRANRRLTPAQFKFAYSGVGRRWFSGDIEKFPVAFIIEHYDWLTEVGFSGSEVLELQDRGHNPGRLTTIINSILGNAPYGPLPEAAFETVRSEPILLKFYLKHAKR